MQDLSDYSPDPVPICPPTHHTVDFFSAENWYGERCTICGLDLTDNDEELAWYLDQVLNDPNLPSSNTEEN